MILQDSDGLSLSVYKMTNVLLNGYNCSFNQDKASFMFTAKKDSDAVILPVKIDNNSEYKIQGMYKKVTSNYELLQTLSSSNDIAENIKIEIMDNDNLDYVSQRKVEKFDKCNTSSQQCNRHVKSIYELYDTKFH